VLNNKQLRTMKDSPILIEQQLKRIHSHKFNEQTMVLIEKEKEED
jgi:spore coat polysaccharide biosynthesis protein SpsF (cytidylyltransferase family)